ncbi:hypothetical protein BDN72DRAFT_928939 [Pluteus cervinus]|uniref:Uncharacterized protein n=1 Tax=Pluteus cervinus TaxID=181527 RepID=A0ACD3AC22_9AGAR|nr:hypothetical protein BDN72DRAFT_928939 [Pluteus cervinus]
MSTDEANVQGAIISVVKFPDSGLRCLTKECFHRIFAMLSPWNVYNFANVEPYFEDVVQGYCNQAFDVKRVLSKHLFPNEMTELHKIMRDCGAIISGSTALELLERVHYPGSTLDIYIEWTHARRLVLWLNDFFEHTGRSDSIVQVFVTRDAALEAVLEFKLSCLMNFITHDGVYSLFPVATLEEGRAWPMNMAYPEEYWLYSKYRVRGYEVMNPTAATSPVSMITRAVGDVNTLNITNIFRKVKQSRMLGPEYDVDFINTFTIKHTSPWSIVSRNSKRYNLQRSCTIAESNAIVQVFEKNGFGVRADWEIRKKLEDLFEPVTIPESKDIVLVRNA